MRPLARRTDPDTSHLAAATVDLNEQCQETLDALRAWRGVAPTSHELAGHDLGRRYRYGRRLPDLRELGLVVNGPARRCGVTGRQAITWHIAPPPGATPQRSLF